MTVGFSFFFLPFSFLAPFRFLGVKKEDSKEMKWFYIYLYTSVRMCTGIVYKSEIFQKCDIFFTIWISKILELIESMKAAMQYRHFKFSFQKFIYLVCCYIFIRI